MSDTSNTTGTATRREAVDFAIRLGATVNDVVSVADKIANFISSGSMPGHPAVLAETEQASYVAEEIINHSTVVSEASLGKTVLVLGPTQHMVSNHMDKLRRVSQAGGQGTLTRLGVAYPSGGVIEGFRAQREIVAGMSADLVVLYDGASTDERFLAASLVMNNGGKVVRLTGF